MPNPQDQLYKKPTKAYKIVSKLRRPFCVSLNPVVERTCVYSGLFCCVVVRLVEDMLADCDRLDVFRGPTGGCFPLAEKQGATGSVR
jgi:hypothetical protein